MPRLLFGHKPGWETAIRSRLAGHYAVTFADLRHHVGASDYDAVVPLTCSDSIHLITSHPDLNFQKFLVPAADTLRMANDKVVFNEFLRAHGYHDHVPGPAGEPPYVFKKRIDEWGIHTRIVEAGEGEEHDGRRYFTQDFVPGSVEYATHLLAWHGEIVYHSSRQYIFAGDRQVKGRGCMPQETHTVPTEHLPLFLSIIRDLQYTGFACIDYKLLDGVVKIFELNPRTGFSLSSTIDEAMGIYLACLARA